MTRAIFGPVLACRRGMVILTVLASACSDGPAEPGESLAAPAGISAWLNANVLPLTTTDPAQSLTDLLPLKSMVGSARVVGMGEASHGAHEFLVMKHRIFRMLTRELSFDVLALEADLTGARRVEDYIQNGNGSPAAALDGLHMWPWLTREMADFVESLRAENAVRAPEDRVHFVGIDGGFPTASMDSVVAYLGRTDEDGAALAVAGYACFRPFSNDESGYTALDYAVVPRAQQDLCRAGLTAVHDYMVEHRETLEASSSPDEYALALRTARLVVQGEDTKRRVDVLARDRYMAENAEWWLDRSGPDARMAIWAHNGHVSTELGGMGTMLREAHGAAYRIIGFSFDDGVILASNEDDGLFSAYDVPAAPKGSYQNYLHGAAASRYILDLAVDTGTPATSWLEGPRIWRDFGCCVRLSEPMWGTRYVSSLPAVYDVIVHFDHVTPSRLLAGTGQ